MVSTTRQKQRQRTTPPPARRHLDYYTVGLAVVLLVVGLIRLRLLPVPFERDEGEYAYIGNLILHGGLPYRDAYNMKLPGTYAMYSLIIAIFGSSPAGIHAGFLIVSLATTVLLYAACRRLFTPTVGLVAATVYALLSVSRPLLGSSAHATHFVNLFVALALYSYSRWRDRRPWMSAGVMGLMFGLGLVMKQPGAFLVIFGGLMVLVRLWPRRWTRVAAAAVAYGAGALLPYAVVVTVMAIAGSLDRFWYWTVTYGSRYGTADTPWEVMKALFALSFGPMFREYPVMWLLALAGLGVVWLTGYERTQKILATLFALFSCAAVLPGLNFREHYFVLVLPAVGLLVGIALEFFADLLLRWRRNRPARVIFALPFAFVAAMGVFAIAGDRVYYIDAPPDEVSRMMYSGNPFVEAREVGARIAQDTTAADTVGIVGSEPEMLVYSGRRSATGYMYVYPLVEPQPDNVRMQREMIAEIEAAQPKYLVYCRVPTSWAATPQSPNDILQWFNRYAPAHYDVVGIVEVGGIGLPAAYFWDGEARGHRPSENSVWLLRRKGA